MMGFNWSFRSGFFFFARCQFLACVVVQCGQDEGVNDLTEDSLELTRATKETICSFHQQKAGDDKARHEGEEMGASIMKNAGWMQNAPKYKTPSISGPKRSFHIDINAHRPKDNNYNTRGCIFIDSRSLLCRRKAH